MKLVTYLAQGKERLGIVLTHPATGEDWVFNPEEAEQRLQFYASRAASALRVNVPRFLQKRPWPQDMVDFLALGMLA